MSDNGRRFWNVRLAMGLAIVLAFASLAFWTGLHVRGPYSGRSGTAPSTPTTPAALPPGAAAPGAGEAPGTPPPAGVPPGWSDGTPGWPGGMPSLPPAGDAAVAVAWRVGPAVVQVNTAVRKVVSDFLGGPMEEDELGLGSGVIFDSRGLVLTNNHVIADASRISVLLPDGRTFRGRLVGSDPFTDLAVVQIVNPRGTLPVAPLGDSDLLQVGQPVVAIGNPYGFSFSVTTGVVSALGRVLPVAGNYHVDLQGLIQTDASINPGNSGGPLLNAAGEVIGLNTAIVQQAQGIGFAIPINLARKVAADLIRYGRVIRIGFSGGNLSPDLVDRIHSEAGIRLPVGQGVFVIDVLPDSPASRAGIQRGDIVTHANGQPVRQMEDLNVLVEKLGRGGHIRLAVVREKKRFQTDVVL
ncbi:MAG: trypsin-like peptidase domain-containing protein [Firmicutes bacterium]|nr:trypsin-like peptidase domain-containing protein [Bacillota bacterium]